MGMLNLRDVILMMMQWGYILDESMGAMKMERQCDY